MIVKESAEKVQEQHAVARGRVKLALGYFLLVALLGLFLRGMLVALMEGVNYKYVLHAHSHVALLGWLYCAFFATLLYTFPPSSAAKKQSFNKQFMCTQVAIVGMLIAFPLQGYALFSIIFSTLHILLSYWFAWSFWRHVKEEAQLWERHQLSLSFILLSLVFLIISSIGPWAMGPILAGGGSGSELYFSAIYFYLHFQYNGWFLFAVLGLFFWLLEVKGIRYSKKKAKATLWMWGLACLPTMLLSVLWTKPAMIWYWLGGAGVMVQVVALVVFLRLLWQVRQELAAQLVPWVRFLLGLALLSLVVKTGLQFASGFPAVADLAYQVRYFIVGYLHLSLIGFVSVFLLAFFLQEKLCSFSRFACFGLATLLLFFFLTEALLFLQGTLLWLGLPFVPNFNLLMFLLSIGMPVGLLLFFLPQVSRKQERQVQQYA